MHNEVATSTCRQPESYDAPGTQVVIANGVLQGVRAIVLGASTEDLVIVMVPLMRGATALALPPWCLRVDDRAANVPDPMMH